MVPISPQAYSAEAVVFDTRPLAALQQKLAAKKAAKDEALDKYFLDLKNKINPAGMRTQDLPEWNKELENWISNGVMNRKEIAKGGMAQQEYLLKYQNLLSKVEQSKQMGKFQSDLESKKQEGKIDEDDFPLLDSIRLSIYNPQHYKNTETLTPYSMGDFSENIPTWDVSKRKQFIDYSAAGVDPAGKINEKSVFDPVTQRKTTTFDKVYTEDQLMKMAERAVAIGSDRSGLKTYKKILESGEQVGKRKVINPVTQQEEIVLEPKVPSEEFIMLAKAYNSVFKNDIMDTPLKVAAADIILNKMGVAGRGETSYAKPGSTGGGTGGGIGGGPTGRIDLTTYRDVGENKDVTDIFQGVKVTGLPKGESMIAKQVLYDQKKNEVTVTEWVGRDLEGNPIGQQTRTIPYDVFLQNIKTLNPQTDFRYIETLPKAKTGKAPSSLTMKESEYRNLSVAKRQEFLSKGGVVVK